MHNISPETCCLHFFEDTDFFKSTGTGSIKNLITGEKHLLRTSLLLFSTPRCCFKGGSKIVFESTIYHLWAIALLSSPLNMFVNSYLQHLSWSILIINVSPSLYCITPSKPADTLSRETLQIFLKTSLTSQQQVSQDEKAENRIKLGSGHMYCEEKH